MHLTAGEVLIAVVIFLTPCMMWSAGVLVTCLYNRVRMVIGSSSSTPPLSTLGASVGVKTSACLVLDTTLGGGLADFFCALSVLRWMGCSAGFWWDGATLVEDQAMVALLVSAIDGMPGVAPGLLLVDCRIQRPGHY